jgi:splicing factor 3A subunit 3
MILEEQRALHEEIERLENAVADRLMEDPKNVSVSLDS